MSSSLPPVERPTSPPPWPPPPDPDRPEARRSPRRSLPQGLVLALSALLGAAVVLAGLLVWAGRGAGDDTTSRAPSTTVHPDPEPDGGTGPGADGRPPPGTAPDTPPPTTPPGGDAAPPPGQVVPLACPGGVPPAICEAADHVQRATGRAFRQFPAVELADDDEFRARLLAGVDDDLPDIEAYGRTLGALGLVDPGVDVVEAVRDLLGAGGVGFYEPTDEVLVVRGTEFTPYTRIVLVHELVHALDDQWFGLDRPELREADSDTAFGFQALFEGHASLIDEGYRATLSQADQQAAAGEELRLLLRSGIDPRSVPPVLAEVLAAPYTLGARLVESIVEQGGPDAVAGAYGRPPASSEQVIDPARYSRGEPAAVVLAPPADGPVVEEDVLGELGLGLWLEDPDAAAGWGGDRYVTWDDGDGWCTRVDLVMDSPGDLAEVRAALDRWAAGGPRRTVAGTATAAGAGLRATGCTPS